jgi:hypothetical protein
MPVHRRSIARRLVTAGAQRFLYSASAARGSVGSQCATLGVGAGRQPRPAADRAVARDHAGRQVDYRERESEIRCWPIARGDDRGQPAMPAADTFVGRRVVQNGQADEGALGGLGPIPFLVLGHCRTVASTQEGSATMVSTVRKPALIGASKLLPPTLLVADSEAIATPVPAL